MGMYQDDKFMINVGLQVTITALYLYQSALFPRLYQSVMKASKSTAKPVLRAKSPARSKSPAKSPARSKSPSKKKQSGASVFISRLREGLPGDGHSLLELGRE